MAEPSTIAMPPTAADEPLETPTRSFLAPAGLAFFAGTAIMVVEIVASRLAAQYLGASLYTWTSAIGSVLVGLTIGNYLGGRLADIGRPRRMLAGVLACASMACLALPSWNLTLRDWEYLWTLGIPARTAAHMLAAFVVPTMLLAMIGPLVARIALDQGRAKGKAIGGLSAWNAAGCITGTFLTGFVLIAWIGSARTLCLVSLSAAICSVLLARDWGVAHLVAYVSAGAMIVSVLPATPARTLSQIIGLRPLTGGDVLEVDESEYSYVSVETSHEAPGVKALRMDQLVHSKGKADDPNYLGYDYERIYSAITTRARPDGKAMRGLVIGGGGYTYPRYFLTHWPQAHMDVVEIDPAVTLAAVKYFGLDTNDPRLQVIHADGRNYIRNLLRRKHAGETVPVYDFIYGDAVNDYSVPHHLTTVEYDRMVSELLSPDGIYLINLIDSFNHGQFLGPVVNTLKSVFPNVNVFSTLPVQKGGGGRDTFVVAASRKPLDTANLSMPTTPGHERPLQPIAQALIDDLIARSGGLTLSDDYAPVQYLLASVVRESLRDVQAFTDRGSEYLNEGNPEQAESYFRRAIELNGEDPQPRVRLAATLVRLNRAMEAIEVLAPLTSSESPNPDALNSLGLALRHLGKIDEAVAAYRRALSLNPDSPALHANLAETLASQDKYAESLPHYSAAIKLESETASYWCGAGMCLSKLHKYDDAQKSLARAGQLDPENPRVLSELAGVAMARQRPADAARLYAAALQRNPDDAQSHYELAVALRRIGRTTDAARQYREALRIAPDWADAHYNLANLLMDQGAARESEDEFRATLKARPDFADAYTNLGLLYEATGRPAEAVRVLEQGLANCKQDVTIGLRLAWILSSSADHNLRQGERALELARKAVNTAGATPSAATLMVLAAAQAQTEKFDKALATIARARAAMTKAGQTSLAPQLDRCEQLYRAHRPFENPPPASRPAATSPASTRR